MNPARQSGHTLAELMIVMVLSSLVMGTVMVVTSGSLATMDHVTRRSDVDQGSLFALRRMSMDACSAISLVTTDADTFTFTVPDITGDSVDDEVSYTLSGSDLIRSVNGTGVPVATDVSLCAFSYVYVDQTADETAPEEEIEEIVIAGFEGYPAAAGVPFAPRPTFSLGRKDVFDQEFDAMADAERPSTITIRVKATNAGEEPMLVEVIDMTDWATLARGHLDNIPDDGVVREYVVPLSWVAPDERGIRKGHRYSTRVCSMTMEYYSGEIEYDRINSWADGYPPWNNNIMPYFSTNYGFSWYNYGDAADMFFVLKGYKRRYHGKRVTESLNLLRAVDVRLTTGSGEYETTRDTRIRLMNH